MRFPARFLSFLLLLFLSLFVLKNVAFAQSLPTNTNPDVPQNLHTWTQNVMIEVSSSLTCLISGVDLLNPNGKCLGVDVQTHKIGYVDNGGGAIGAMGGLIAMTFNPPVHTRDYIKYISSNFGLVKNTYAADYPNGIGFGQLNPLLGAWTVFRNITYLIFVLAFIVIGFAIMLRVHIDPRTVMTIENQIPKIIIALILVTFSFAIVGFLVDLMYVGMYLVYGIFSQIPNTNFADLSPSVIQGKNAFEAANGLSSAGGVFGYGTTITSQVLGTIMNFLGIGGAAGGFFDASIINGLIHAISGGVGLYIGIQGAQIPGSIVSWIPFVGEGEHTLIGAGAGTAAAAGTELFLRNILPNVIVYLVITIALLFALFRLWFTLIMAYVFLLIDVVFVPFWIIAGLLPGSNLNFTSWLRETGAEIISFPATLVMLLLGRFFADSFATNSSQYFVPPFIGNSSEPKVMGALIGFGIILMTPNVVGMMKGWLKAPRLDISAIGAAVGVGTGALSSSVTGVPKLGSALNAAAEGRSQGGLLGAYRGFMGEWRFPGSKGGGH